MTMGMDCLIWQRLELESTMEHPITEQTHWTLIPTVTEFVMDQTQFGQSVSTDRTLTHSEQTMEETSSL